MKAKTKNAVMATLVLAMGVMVAGSALAKGNGRKKHKEAARQEAQAGKQGGEAAAERKAFMAEQKKKIGAFFKGQKVKMKSFMEACQKESDPQKVLQMVKENHARMTAERKKFFEGIAADRQAFMESMFKKYNVAEEEQKKVEARIKARTEKMKAMGAKREKAFEKVIAGLEKKENLTKEDIKAALHKLHAGHGKPGHKGGQGKAKKHGKGKKQGQGQGGCDGGNCDEGKCAGGNCGQ